jgi:DnaK suppressor protein
MSFEFNPSYREALSADTERCADPLGQASQLEEMERVHSRKAAALPTRFAEQPDDETTEDGVYHRYCLDCGSEIPEKRIALVPFTVCCVECQSRREQRGVIAKSKGGLSAYDTAVPETVKPRLTPADLEAEH